MNPLGGQSALVMILKGDRFEPVAAERSATKGLGVMPVWDAATRAYSGRWQVVHLVAHRPLGSPTCDLARARSVARRLQNTGASWDQWNPIPNEAVRAAVDDVLAELDRPDELVDTEARSACLNGAGAA